ncbi:PREDICTED: uncharacterized protein LOC106793464 [Polistes canadensis]|uniref:uncharacterized protein LOC106793464 n=1 Tax=Polistes canadensis TaxID=91411 RepID=UPI000718B7C6|nr:PREDICTED: uncharacterized protein LOC106793464 [Polistes canadensis]
MTAQKLKMEELFVLKPENLDHLLPQIKGNLTFPNEKSQMSALEQLAKLLKTQVSDIRSNIFTKLIKFDIISTLCDILKTFREPLLTSAFECLALVSEYQKFYENQVAVEAVSSLFHLAHYIEMSTDIQICPLEKLLSAIRNILFNARKLGIEIDSVCSINQMFSFLKNLSQKCLSRVLKFMIIDILNTTLESVTLDENENENGRLILDVCIESIKSMKDIVEHDYEQEYECYSKKNAIVALCCLCATSIRFCDKDHLTDVDEGGNMTPMQGKVSLAKSIYAIVIYTIMPYVKVREIH